MAEWDLDRMMRLWAGNTRAEATRRPKSKETIERYWQSIGSGKPLRTLGWASDGEMLLSEEARESHIHILGAPGEGKSKLIEMLVEQDIMAGYGALVLDPSDNGDTVYKVLKFCCKYGHNKVILIDPNHINEFGKVVSINPIHYKSPANVCVGNIEDTVRILWGSRLGETAKIDKYLPAIIRTLHSAEATLHDALYFTEKDHPSYQAKRQQMIETMHPEDRSAVTLNTVYKKGPSLFANEMDSTFRRFEPFFDDVMKLMVGSKKHPLNFQKLVAEGWVILVNLDSTGVWGEAQQRLLGTMILNEVVYAISRLRASGWRGMYYVYIDEVGDYATPKLAEVLDRRRKSGMRFCLAHQRFDQLEDKNVLSAVMGSTKIKVLFNVPNRDDRDRMIRMMYGGDIPDRQVSYELGNLRKQEAAIKINKQPPRKTLLGNVPDVEVDPKVFKAFKEKLLQHEAFRTPREVLDEINARFKQPSRTVHPQQPGVPREPRKPARSNQKVAKHPAKNDGGTNRKAGPPAPPRRTFKSVFSEEED